MDLSGKRLKTAAAIGHVVEITDEPVAHDIVTVKRASPGTLPLANKQRARDNLARLDIYEKIGKLTHASVTKLTILQMSPPKADTLVDLYHAFLNQSYAPVVLVSLDDPNDAMLYRLSL